MSGLSLSFIPGAILLAEVIFATVQNLPCHATVRLTASIYQEVAVHAANGFILSHLHSCSVSPQRYSLTVALHSHSYSLAEV